MDNKVKIMCKDCTYYMNGDDRTMCHGNVQGYCLDEEDEDKMVSSTILLQYLDEEVERHKEAEGKQPKSWGRGFHTGSMTEAIHLRIKVRELMKVCGQ